MASVAIKVKPFQDEDGRNTEHGINTRRKRKSDSGLALKGKQQSQYKISLIFIHTILCHFLLFVYFCSEHKFILYQQLSHDSVGYCQLPKVQLSIQNVPS